MAICTSRFGKIFDKLGANFGQVTDETAGILGCARYNAFGRLLENTIPATATQRLYTGLAYNPNTDLYKIGA